MFSRVFLHTKPISRELNDYVRTYANPTAVFMKRAVNDLIEKQQDLSDNVDRLKIINSLKLNLKKRENERSQLIKSLKSKIMDSLKAKKSTTKSNRENNFSNDFLSSFIKSGYGIF